MKTMLQSLCLIFTLLFAAAAPQAFADGKEPAVQATPVVNINSASYTFSLPARKARMWLRP